MNTNEVHHETKIDPKIFLKTAALFGVLPSMTIGSMKALASSPQLDLKNPQAKALEYNHESVIADENYANYRLYIRDVSQFLSSCAILPNQNVASTGWCKHG